MTWPTVEDGTLRPFPTADASFVDPRFAERVLAPLVSLDLAAVDPEWSGWLPIVAPFEPAEGYVGERTTGVHSYFARTNWLGFELTQDGRLDFKGDWAFFEHYAHPSRALTAHYEDQLAGFAQTRALAREHGALIHLQDLEYYPIEQLLTRPQDWLVDVADPQPYGANWQHPRLFELGGIEHGEEYGLSGVGGTDVHPLMPNGDRFHFVASVVGAHYLPRGADEVLVFFEPTSRTVLVTFDYD